MTRDRLKATRLSLGDALTRRSAALRVEPSAKSQSKTAAAIAPLEKLIMLFVAAFIGWVLAVMP